MWFTGSISGDLVALFITILVILIGYYQWTHQYWSRRNLPYLAPKMPLGNFGNVSGKREHLGIEIKRLYDIMKQKGWKHGGIYLLWSPVYLVIDLDYVKNIVTKDFQYFSDRGIYHNEKADPLSAHLLHIGGVKWRNLRTKLSPTFTPARLNTMFQTLVDCELNLQKQMELKCQRKKSVEIKEILSCFAINVIGSCAFGLECNTFEEESSPFRVFGRNISASSRSRQLKRAFTNAYPTLSQFFNVALYPKDISSFFMKVVKDTVNYRETNNIVRKDFMQLLIDLKNNKLAEEEGYKRDGTTLNIEEIAAQCFVFFIAGFDTSSATMTFALYELAKHQEIQEKVRNEINFVLANYEGKITYDAIHEMKYMNQVIDEALRKYPPAPHIQRRCVKDYHVPNTDIIIEKGTRVLIPVLGIHHDAEYYPNPEKFDPERFSEENKNLRHSLSHIPFGEGPRICIAKRFGLMQSKVGLTSLLKNFKFTVNEKTKEPLQMKPNPLILTADIWLDVDKL